MKHCVGSSGRRFPREFAESVACCVSGQSQVYLGWERDGNSCIRELGIASGAGVGLGFSEDRPVPWSLSLFDWNPSFHPIELGLSLVEAGNFPSVPIGGFLGAIQLPVGLPIGVPSNSKVFPRPAQKVAIYQDSWTNTRRLAICQRPVPSVIK